MYQHHLHHHFTIVISPLLHHHLVPAIVENITELRPSSVIDCTNQGIMDWLLKRLKVSRDHNNNNNICLY